MSLRPQDLEGDRVGRGGGWERTNNTLAVTMALHDVKARTGMSGGELFGALVENVISAIQGSCAPRDWREAGNGVCEKIMRRMTPR